MRPFLRKYKTAVLSILARMKNTAVLSSDVSYGLDAILQEHQYIRHKEKTATRDQQLNFRNQTANHSTIDSKSAFPYFEDGKNIAGIIVPLKYDIVSSGADNGNDTAIPFYTIRNSFSCSIYLQKINIPQIISGRKPQVSSTIHPPEMPMCMMRRTSELALFIKE